MKSLLLSCILCASVMSTAVATEHVLITQPAYPQVFGDLVVVQQSPDNKLYVHCVNGDEVEVFHHIKSVHTYIHQGVVIVVIRSSSGNTDTFVNGQCHVEEKGDKP